MTRQFWEVQKADGRIAVGALSLAVRATKKNDVETSFSA
jgi:hypothetical protein